MKTNFIKCPNCKNKLPWNKLREFPLDCLCGAKVTSQEIKVVKK